jgi:hypothetical protein
MPKRIGLCVMFCFCGGLVAAAAAPTMNGLVCWVKADTGVMTNASGVYRWQDQSGLGNDATQSVAAREPALVQSAAGVHGDIAELRIYRAALTTQEINQVRRQLYRYYFESPSGTVVTLK